jgi:hypothetical protein
MIADELNLFERRGAQTRTGFAPTRAAVFGRKKNAIDSGSFGVDITRDENVRADRIDRGHFEKYSAGAIFGAGETKGVNVLWRAGVVDMDGGLREKGGEKDQQQAGLHEIPTVQ